MQSHFTDGRVSLVVIETCSGVGPISRILSQEGSGRRVGKGSSGLEKFTDSRSEVPLILD